MQACIDFAKQISALASYVSDSTKQYYLVCGAANAGKETFIHYLLDSQMQLDVDDQGQDVFKIQQQLNKIVIVQKMVELYNFQSQIAARYIWLNQLPSNLDHQNRLKWCICLDFLLKLLIGKKFKIFFVFSPQTQDLMSQLLSFHDSFKVINELNQTTYIVLSKIYEESQMHQFIEQKLPQLIEEKKELQYLKDIAQKQKFFCFFTHDIDEDERNEVKQKVCSNQVFEGQLDLAYQNVRTWQYIKQWKQANLWRQNSKYLQKKIFQAMHSIIIVTLQAKAKKTIFSQAKNTLLNLWKELFGTQIVLQFNEKIEAKLIVQKFEQLYKSFKKQPDNFLSEVTKQMIYFEQCFSQTEQLSALRDYQQIIQIMHMSTNSSIAGDLEQFQNIFIKGMFSEQTFQTIFQCLKNDFSKQIYQKMEKKQEVTTKKKVMSAYPDYEIQKKDYISQNISLSKVYNLPSSPLKFDLLFQQLHNQFNSKAQNILKQKILIKSICKILQFYNMFHESLQLFTIIPDFNSIELMLQQICINYNNQIPAQQKGFIKNVIQFCLKHRRRYVVESAINLITKGNEQQLEEFDKIQNEAFQVAHVGEFFMDKTIFLGLKNKKDDIIKRMIDYENQNWRNVQIDLCIEQILKGELQILA